MAPDLSFGFALKPLDCGRRGLVALALSTLGRPLIFGRAVGPDELPGGSWTLVRLRKEKRFFSFFDGLGERRSMGLGDLAVISAGVVIAAPVCASPESHVADVSGRSPEGKGPASVASSWANVISKPIHSSAETPTQLIEAHYSRCCKSALVAWCAGRE
jgi:hypothetical protein